MAAVSEVEVVAPPDELVVHVDEPEGTPWDPQPPLWEEEEEEEEEGWPPPREDTRAVKDKVGGSKAEKQAGGKTGATDEDAAASGKDGAGCEQADTDSVGGGGDSGASGGNGEARGGGSSDGGDGDDGDDGEEEEYSTAAEELLSVLPEEHREVLEKAAQDENVSRLAKVTGILQGMFSRTVSTLLDAIPVPVLVSFIGVFTTYMGHRFQRYQAAESAKRKARVAEREARARQEAEMAAFYSDFTGPLLRASAKLQERLHCIARIKSRALAADTAVTASRGAAADGQSVPSDEVRDPTHMAYLLARYFGVLERLKAGSHAMDFGRPAADRIFLNIVGRIQGILSASDERLAALQRSELDFSAASGRPAPQPAGPLRVPTHHQRVAGELMLRSRWFPDTPNVDVATELAGRPGQHVALLPYDEWCKLLDTEPEMKRWMRPLVSEAWRLIHYMDPPPAVAPPPPLDDGIQDVTTAEAAGMAAAAVSAARSIRPTAVPLGSERSRLFTPFFAARSPRPPSPTLTPIADAATRRNVRADVTQLPVEPVELARIFFLHDALVDLVDFLDPPPNCRFIPAARRKRLRLAGAPPRPDTPMPASLQLLYQELADVHSGHIPKRLDNHRRWGSRALEVYVKAPVFAPSATAEKGTPVLRPPARQQGGFMAAAAAPDAASTTFAADDAHPGAGAALDSGARRGDCPNSQRVLMALEELRIPYTLHKVNTLIKPPWYHLLSVEGRVPLLYHEGRLVETAPQIVTYLQRRFPNAGAVKRRPLLPLALSESQLTAFARVGQDWLTGAPGVTAADVEASLRVVERVLAANARLRRGPYLGGRVLCWEDLALLPPLYHLTAAAEAVRGWTLPPSLPHTAAYLAAGRRARSFVKAAPTVEAIAAGAARLIQDGPDVDTDLPDIIE
ncbi:hypothetical protein MMPV_001263 [Pyropia vietnamensis]